MVPFSDWVKTQTHRFDDVGKLARLAAGNSDWPSAGDLEACLVHVKTRLKLDARSIEALIQAWSDYKIVVRCTPPDPAVKYESA